MKNDTPLTDHRLSLDDPLTGFSTEDGGPLSGFPTEGLEGTEVTCGITHVTSRISPPACSTVASPNVEPATVASPNVERAARRESNSRWFVGTAMLVVGLLVGYAAGVITPTRNAEDQNASGSSFAADRADSGPERGEVRATAGPSSSGRIVDGVNDELKKSEPDSKPTQPESIDLRQRPVSQPVNTVGIPEIRNEVPATELGVLHLESRPTGAQVHLDDRLVGTTPFRMYGVPPGSHTVRMELQGYIEWSTSVHVEAGSLARIAASLEQ
jgi:hypothetical protein